MGSIPPKKTITTFDPKSLQIDLVTEISVLKDDEKKKKSSSTLNIHDKQTDHIPQNDPKLFAYFLCSKFDALKELNLNDDLEDGNPIEIKKVNINKKVFPKKSSHFKLTKINNSNKNLNPQKIQKPINPKRKQFSCVNVINKDEFYKIGDLNGKSNSGKNKEFILHEGNCKSPQTKLRRRKKQVKSKKNKNYKKTPSMSTIKSKKSDYENNLNDEKNMKDSLEPIRAILEEMGL